MAIGTTPAIAYNAPKRASVPGRGAAPTHFCNPQIAPALQSPSTSSQATIHIRSASVRLRLLRRPPVRLTRRSTAKLLLSPALILVPRRLARASGEPYPAPVRIIIPYPAGGPYDGIPRLIAQWIGAKHGWSIVIGKRAGAAATRRRDPAEKAG